MSKHTPGPWHADLADGWGSHLVRSERNAYDGQNLLCLVSDRTTAFAPDDDEAEANARLIAAAPELLAFAQRFLADYQSEDGLDSMKHYAREAYEAIQKATGSTE